MIKKITFFGGGELPFPPYPPMLMQPHNDPAAPMLIQPHNCRIGAKILIDICYVKLFNK